MVKIVVSIYIQSHISKNRKHPLLGPSLCVFIPTFLSLFFSTQFLLLLYSVSHSSLFMSASSSSSSSSSSQDGNGGAYVPGRRGGDFEGPSSSRRRALNEVWPEPFLEALATQVAIDASRSSGRLAAAPALANVFQVPSSQSFIFVPRS